MKNDKHEKRLKKSIPKYDISRVLNLSPGDLITFIGNRMRKVEDEKGYIIKKSQPRRPHRTDVYLVKLQGRQPKEIDERWLLKLEEGNE